MSLETATIQGVGLCSLVSRPIMLKRYCMTEICPRALPRHYVHDTFAIPVDHCSCRTWLMTIANLQFLQSYKKRKLTDIRLILAFLKHMQYTKG